MNPAPRWMENSVLRWERAAAGAHHLDLRSRSTAFLSILKYLPPPQVPYLQHGDNKNAYLIPVVVTTKGVTPCTLIHGETHVSRCSHYHHHQNPHYRLCASFDPLLSCSLLLARLSTNSEVLQILDSLLFLAYVIQNQCKFLFFYFFKAKNPSWYNPTTR